MADYCPICGSRAPAFQITKCSACGAVFAAPESSVQATLPAHLNPPPVDPPLDDEFQMPALHLPARPRWPAVPAWFLAPLSGLLGVMHAFLFRGRFSASPEFFTIETISGGVLGVLIGAAIGWDFGRVRKRTVEIDAASWKDQIAASDGPSIVRRPSEWIAVLMLVVPAAAGVMIWQGGDLHLTKRAISLIVSATILATAILGYFSMRQLALRGGRRPEHEDTSSNPAFAYLGLLGLWIVFYPAHFYARKNLGGRNLIAFAVIGIIVFLGPALYAWQQRTIVPEVDSPEVLNVLGKLVNDNDHEAPKDIRMPTEISFDLNQQKRIARATLVWANGEEEPVDYVVKANGPNCVVELHNRLPGVDTANVKSLIEKLILDDPANPGQRQVLGPISILGAKQISFDRNLQRRVGEAKVVTKIGEEKVAYRVEWDNAERTMIRVEILPNPP